MCTRHGRVFALWRTGLSGPVIVLQAGTALNYFGTGLIVPFEIIYLHHARGFSTTAAGFVLAAVMGTAAVVTLPSGALLDRFRAKPLLITGNIASALGYTGFAFVDRPWQAFVCSVVGGAGFGVAQTANQVLSLTLVPAEQRAASVALRRVAGNFGIGSGATVAGFVVASESHLRVFQALYVFDGLTFGAFALVVLIGIPNLDVAHAAPRSDSGTGFRAVVRDRLLLALVAANVVLVMVGGALFTNILSPFALAHTPVGPREVGIIVFLNTFFIVVAQVPATQFVTRMRRTHALAATCAIFAVGLLAVLLATLTRSTLTATIVLAGVAIVIAIAECAQFVVLGPLVAELAPPHLLGRYMSLYGLTFTVGVALGPAVGGALLTSSPDAIWWGGALALVLTGAGLLRLGDRIPDPLINSRLWTPGAAKVPTNAS
jgi:MFS family permease